MIAIKSLTILAIIFQLIMPTTPIIDTPPSAEKVLADAIKKAKAENKKVFLIFYASWCGWCHKMDRAMAEPEMKPLFENNYVITHLVALENAKNKDLENPGATEMFKKYAGEKSGIPFWQIFDGDGKLVADSQRRNEGADLNSPGRNVGCPATQEEVTHFLTVLQKTSDLGSDDLKKIEERFRKNEMKR